jgi:hypothetical protein
LQASTLRKIVFVSVAAFQALFLVDAALRWELGFGFVRPVWVLDVCLVLAVQLGLLTALLGRPSPGWLAALVALPALVVAFMAASSGSPLIAWKTAPFISFTIGPDWVTRLFEDDGNYSALVGAIAHGLSVEGYRRATRSDAARRGAWLLLGLGAAWLSACALVFAEPVAMHSDPRPALDAARAWVQRVRTPFWIGVAALSAGALMAGAWRLATSKPDPSPRPAL